MTKTNALAILLLMSETIGMVLTRGYGIGSDEA